MTEYNKEWPFNQQEESFIQSLGEARMFRTRDQISREGARSITDHMFVSILSLYAMSNNYSYAPVAANYAKHTLSRGGFNTPSPSGTDLYQTIFTMKRPGDLFKSPADGMLSNKVNLDENRLKRFLRGIADGTISSGEASSFLYKLERDLKIQDPKLRAARRLIQDWDTLNTTQQKLAGNQLMQHYRLHGRRSDLMPLFTSFAKDNNLELDTGEKKGIMKRIGRFAAASAGGFALGYAAGKATEL